MSVHIKYYPVRFEKEFTESEVKFRRDSTIKDYIIDSLITELILKLDIDFDSLDTIVEGKVVKDINSKVDNQSEIIITPKIEFTAIATWWAAATFWQGVALVVGVLATAYSIYQAVVASGRKPNFGSYGSGMDEGSSTYGWDGIRTVQEVGIPVKVIGGRHRTGGNIINQFISTDGDKQYLNLLIGVCEGPIRDITDIEINGNPIANFTDIETIKRLGTNDQVVIPGFEDLHNVYNINAQLMKDSSYVYTTVDSDVEGFEIYLTLPSGLFQISSGGGLQSWDVTYQVEYKLHAAGEYIDLGVTTISALSRSAVRRIFKKAELASGQYDIRITRTSDDSSLDPQMVGDLYLSSVDEIKTDNLIYPNTALLGIKALATNQLSGSTPNITFIAEDAKVTFPDVLTVEAGDPVDWEDYYWDPDTELFRLFSDDSALYWDGTSYTTGFCANPIWFNKDLLLATRYGLGEYLELDNVDADELLQEALYCETKVPDGAGGYEKRFRMDVVLDTPVKAPDLLAQLTAVFRAFPFYSQNGFSMRIDRPGLARQTFGMGNIGEDTFQQAWKSKNEVFNVIEVQFADEEMNYQDETISIEDEESLNAGDPRRSKKLRVFTTKKSYAIREGRYALWVSKYINRSGNHKAFMDAVICQVGDIINVSHDVPQWGFSGRVLAGSTTTLVKLDREVTIEAVKTYHLLVRFADNTHEERVVTDSPGTYTELNVSVAFSNAPAAFDVYSFGEVDKVTKPFRLINLKRENNGDAGLAYVEYNESIYDDSAVVLPTNNYSALSLAIPNVSNLKLTERLIKLGDGTIENAIDVWFDKPYIGSAYVRTIKKVRIYLSDNGSSWIYRGETMGTYFPIIGNLVDGTLYYVKAVTVANDGAEGDMELSPSDSITIIGKSAPPENIVVFLVNQSRDRLYFGWSPVGDIDLSSYEIRYGEDWESGYAIASGLKSTSHIELNFRIGASQSFWIKALDTSGNYSAEPTESVITIENIPFTNVIASYSEDPAWSGDKSNTVRITGGILEISDGVLSGTYTVPVRDVGYVATFKVGIEEVVTLVASDRRWDDDPDARFGDSETDRFSGSEIAGAASFEIRVSTDGADPDVDVWTAWAPWQAGDYYCRWFQIRMTLTRELVSQQVQCSQLDYYADLPDVDEVQDGEVTVAADGDDIVFVKTFHEDPGINITILSGDGMVWKGTGLSTTGVNIKLYDLAGTLKIGTFRITIHGV